MLAAERACVISYPNSGLDMPTSARQDRDRRGWGEDTDVVVDTGATDVKQTVEESDGQAAEPPPADSPVETETARVAPTEQRAWSMPKSPVSRKQADAWGRIALKAGAGIARFAAGVARYGARVVEQLWLAIGKVPAALRLLFVVGILMLLGVVGSIALHSFPRDGVRRCRGPGVCDHLRRAGIPLVPRTP